MKHHWLTSSNTVTRSTTSNVTQSNTTLLKLIASPSIDIISQNADNRSHALHSVLAPRTVPSEMKYVKLSLHLTNFIKLWQTVLGCAFKRCSGNLTFP